MRKIFEEYGSIIVTVVAVCTLIGFCAYIMMPTGIMADAFGRITSMFTDKSQVLIQDVGSIDGNGGSGGNGGAGESGGSGGADSGLNQYGFYFGRLYIAADSSSGCILYEDTSIKYCMPINISYGYNPDASLRMTTVEVIPAGTYSYEELGITGSDAGRQLTFGEETFYLSDSGVQGIYVNMEYSATFIKDEVEYTYTAILDETGTLYIRKCENGVLQNDWSIDVYCEPGYENITFVDSSAGRDFAAFASLDGNLLCLDSLDGVPLNVGLSKSSGESGESGGNGGAGESGGSGGQDELNEFGFYFGRSYSLDAGGSKQTMIFNEDNTAEFIFDGVSQGEAPWTFNNNTIYFNTFGMSFTVLNNGTQLARVEAILSNPTSTMNQYGFFFDEPYAYTNGTGTVVFYEDGTADETENGVTGKVSLVYGEKSIMDANSQVLVWRATDDGLVLYTPSVVFILDN